MLSTNIFLFLLLILPCRIIADDSGSFKPQDLTYTPIASSDADALQPVTDPDLNPEILLAGSENNVVAGCQGSPPGGSTRRSRLRKRQTDFCSWHPFQSGAPPTTDKPGATSHDGAGNPLVPTVRIGPTDVTKPDEDNPNPIPFGASKRPEVCGTAEETIPVCHYLPGQRGSSRWLSPALVLTPIRLYRPGDICMGLEETWCCSSTSPRPSESLDTFYPAAALLYPMAGQQCTFIKGPTMGRGG